MVFSECTLVETGSCHICECHVLVYTDTRVIQNIRSVKTVFACEFEVLKDIMEYFFSVVTTGIKDRVVRLEVFVNPRYVSESLELTHVCIGSPESGNAHVVSISFRSNIVLRTVHVLDHIVYLTEETPIARTPSVTFVCVPDARVILIT